MDDEIVQEEVSDISESESDSKELKFEDLINEIESKSLDILGKKLQLYSAGGDVLHNFKAGSSISGLTPMQVAWVYMTKHFVALRDKIESNDFSNMEDFEEKCIDIMNYIRYIWVMAKITNYVKENN